MSRLKGLLVIAHHLKLQFKENHVILCVVFVFQPLQKFILTVICCLVIILLSLFQLVLKD